MQLPQGIDSKFRYILVAAKRARQLQAGAKPMIQTQSKKLTKVAQQEVEAGLVPFQNLELASNNGEKARKTKLSK
ncbi:MAG: DNA-directed RNA polymerase subunit omega [Acidobacteria bacterium]|nr:MAG: DNA-directed RNA polymerase subunit omega [Acidobacteriota bacterium]